MPYQIDMTPAAQKSLDRLPDKSAARIADALERLRDDPRPSGCVKLSGSEELWRIRVGDYRVVYEIHDQRLVVLIVRVGHRKDIYRKGT